MDSLIRMFVVYWLIRLHNCQPDQVLNVVLLDVGIKFICHGFVEGWDGRDPGAGSIVGFWKVTERPLLSAGEITHLK